LRDIEKLMIETSTIRHQAGVIAYRVLDDEIRVLLITSRDTGRWIIPKGNIGVHATPAETAEKEAYEEAGIRGTVAGSVPLGFYTYFKRLDFGETLPATVAVYPLQVTKQCKKWPEKGERRLAWVSLEEAIALIDEPGLIPLLRRLTQLQNPEHR
jgi:8-oxo-dGTP pyrophosphatase MutT (NUDIX family)